MTHPPETHPVASPILRQTPPSAEERHAMIAEAAYFFALRRGFAAGHEIEDWLAAEREIRRRFP